MRWEGAKGGLAFAGWVFTLGLYGQTQIPSRPASLLRQRGQVTGLSTDFPTWEMEIKNSTSPTLL